MNINKFKNIYDVKSRLKQAKNYVDIEFALNYIIDNKLRAECFYIMNERKLNGDSVANCIEEIENDVLDLIFN